MSCLAGSVKGFSFLYDVQEPTTTQQCMLIKSINLNFSNHLYITYLNTILMKDELNPFYKFITVMINDRMIYYEMHN